MDGEQNPMPDNGGSDTPTPGAPDEGTKPEGGDMPAGQ